ncbi:MAG TPA: DMT family transporter [Burkholderiaceae bacterium]|nr:DMT family transporter [Burkholderiaceae bacterium]
MQLNPRLAFVLTLPPLMWAGNVVIGRLMVGTSPPVLLNLIRWVGAMLLLLPLGWRAFGTPAARAQVRSRWPHLALLGLLGVGIYNALQYMALRTSSPLNVTLIAASAPLWMMLNGMLFFRVQPSRRDGLAAVLSLAGVVTVLTRGHLLELAQIRLVPGDLLILVAIFCWSIYSWLLAKPPHSMRGAARPSWNWAEFLLVQVAFGIVWAGAGAAVEAVALSEADERLRWGWPLALALMYLATCPSLIAYYAWGTGVAQAGPAMAALFSNLTPLLTAVISGAVFGTWPQAYHFAAFALIVAGIMASALRKPPAA